MRLSYITGRAAAERPDINRLRAHATFIPASNQHHDTSGIRRRVRRAAARAAR